MGSIRTATQLLLTDWRGFLDATFNFLNRNGLLHWVRDPLFLRIDYWLKIGKKLNLENPHFFNEKIQWLKLHDRRPEYVIMVDKIAVKEYVAGLIGYDYIIPTLGVWKKPEDIDWGSLPNRFVLKWNHDSGSIVICRDKNKLDKESAIKKLSYGAKVNGYWYGREWPYKGVKPLILAEVLLGPNSETKPIPDYKWFCFNGEPVFCQVIQDRFTKETIDFFDTEWRHQEFIGLNPVAVPAEVIPSRPRNLETQISIARRLSQGIPFSRIDLYEINEQVYFGEITLYPASGFGEFYPPKYNEIIGKMLHLPGENEAH